MSPIRELSMKLTYLYMSMNMYEYMHMYKSRTISPLVQTHYTSEQTLYVCLLAHL